MDRPIAIPHAWLLTVGLMLIMVGASIGGFVLYKYVDDVGADLLIYDTWLNEKRDLLSKLGDTTVPVDEKGNPMRDDYITRSGGGSLKWMTTLFEGEGEYLSSPAVLDLNNDNDLEVVIASAGDYVFALGPDGEYYWSQPYSDDIIDYLGQTAGTSGLDFDPPHIFSSVIAADVNLGDTPEIIIGVKDGALCIGDEGKKQWKKGMTTGYYFSTACITDLEGDWTGNKEDLEIVLASDDEGRRGWLEAFEVDGGAIFREEAPTGSEGGLIGCSVVAHDLDGDFWDGPFLINPDVSKERDTELIIGNHDRGLRIWVRQGENAEHKPNYDESTGGNLGGHQTYATSAVANVTGTPECEIFVGCSEGYPRTWTGWGGKLYVYTPGGKKLWDYSTGSSRASIFSSPAIADLQIAKDDPEEKHLDYEVVFGADNGMMYVMNTEFHSLLWSFDTGGRCMSSPAICNIDNDDELEILIGSDSGKVFCFDGDPSDGIDEGVNYPGDGPNQDVLWIYDTQVPIGISSPVVADIDLDGMLEVIIGDQEGHVYCIAAGGRSVKGQEDWTEFHCNLNRTGFYNPQTSYGVDIYPKLDEFGRPDTMVKSIQPGSFVQFNLTVENTGKGITEMNRDKIYVKIQQESVPDYWSAWLDTPPDKGNDNPDYVRLASQETAHVTLWVYAPWEGDIGEMARINVTANSSSDEWSEDTATTLSVLNLFVDFELFYLKAVDQDPLSELVGRKWDKINPGDDQIYTISIRNKGNLNDTYMLTLSTPPRDAGWNWYFVETGTLNASTSLTAQVLADQFGGISGQTFIVKVECPIEATRDTKIPILLKGVSVLSMSSDIEEITQKDELIMVVGEHNELQLKIEDSTKFVNPNATVEFYLLITNLGNKDVINVLLSVQGRISGWDVKFPEEPIPVYQGQTKTVPIVIRAPNWAQANSKLVLNMIGEIEGAPNFKSTAPLTVIVNHVYDFDAVVIEKQGVYVEPGETVWFTMQISNLGNGDDDISPSAFEILLDWNMTFYNKEGFQKYDVTIDFEELIYLYGRIKVPENTRTGLYPVGVNLSGEGSSLVVYVKVFVNQTFDLRVTSIDDDHNISANIRPDQEKPFVIKVSNKGNGLETVTMRLGAQYDHTNDAMGVLYDGWEGKFVAVANTPDFTTNILPYDFREPIVIRNTEWDTYYTPNFTAAAASGTNLDEIREIVLVLDMGQTAWVHLNLKAPAFEVGEPSGTGIEVAGSGIGPKDYDLTHLTLFVLFPDLEFVGKVEFSGGTSDNYDAKVGDVLTIIVRLMNSGDIPAENVDVQLLIDGVDKKTSTLRTVKNDTEDVKTVIFSWVAEAGEHNIKVVIDPNNNIIESHDQFTRGGEGNNNELKARVDVEGSFVVKELVNDYPVVSTMLIILLAIVILVGAALLLKGSKKI
ncbi:MAG: CARDB domain-containing protein [Thermoplasmatota archaeon]